MLAMPLSRPTINAWMMLGFAALVAGGFAVALGYHQVRDANTLCIKGEELGQTIVLVDKTDKWNPNQSDRLEQHVLDVLNVEMKQEERLRVFSFGATFVPGFRENFTGCKPPDGRNCKGIFCSPERLREQYQQRFLSPLLSELKTLKIPTKGDCSPIAEVLVEVMSRKEVKLQPGKTRIVLISDMAQNTPLYTAFRGRPTCPGVTGGTDPERDNSLLNHFEKFKAEMRLADTSVLVFQVTPDGRSPDVGILAKRKWDEVFQALKIEQNPESWQRL